MTVLGCVCGGSVGVGCGWVAEMGCVPCRGVWVGDDDDAGGAGNRRRMSVAADAVAHVQKGAARLLVARLA
jgi:hypothetical protein